MIKLGRTSEATALGHPDIVTDTIVDSLVDLALKQNKDARCGFEAISAKGEVIIRGEVGGTELKKSDVDDVIRRVVKFIGYDEIDGFDWQTLKTNIFINTQSGDIAQGVVSSLNESTTLVKGYGDNGIYFGHYTDETPLGLIAPFFITKELMAIHSFMDSEVRRNLGIRPDAKCQFTEPNGSNNPGTLVFCVSHDEGADVVSYVNAVIAKFCDTYPQFSDMLLNSEKFINPTGRFVVCGPAGDCGTVGRKLTATTYGGVVPIGGGALCMPGYVKVETDKGLVNLSELKENDKVIVAGSSYNVYKKYSTGIKQTFKISTERGYNVDASGEHLIKVVSSDGKFDFVRTDELEEGRWVVLDKQESFGNQHIDDAYLLGFVIGDGWLSAHDNSVNVKIPVFDRGSKIECEFERLFGDKFKIYDNLTSDEADCQMFRLFYCNKDYRAKLTDYGMRPCGALNKEIPSVIYSADKSSVAEFIQGLFDADGCVRVSQGNRESLRINYTSSSLKLINQLQHLLLKFGVFTRRSIVEAKDSIIKGRKIHQETSYVLSISGKESLENFVNLIGFGLERKKELCKVLQLSDRSLVPGLKSHYCKLYRESSEFRAWLIENRMDSARKTFCESGSAEKIGEELTRDNLNKFLTFEHLPIELKELTIQRLKFYYDKVTSVEYIGENEMFDIQVEGINEFVADGFSVHNCGKCPTKSDRSLQLMARYLARKISEKYELNEVKVSLSTGIGLSEPTSLKVETSRPEVNTEAEHWVLNHFDLTPSGVIKELDLKNIEYAPSAMNGHFGVSPFMPSDLARKSFTWER